MYIIGYERFTNIFLYNYFFLQNAIKLASCKHEREKEILTAENNHELQSEITIVLTCFIYENLKRAT